MLPPICVVTHVSSKSGKILMNCTSRATRENWHLEACKTSSFDFIKVRPIINF